MMTTRKSRSNDRSISIGSKELSHLIHYTDLDGVDEEIDMYNHSKFIPLDGRSHSFSNLNVVDMEELPREDILRGICEIIHEHVDESIKSKYRPSEDFRVFNVSACSMVDSEDIHADLPTVQSIFEFFSFINKESQLEYDCMLISLIYLERMMERTNGKFKICVANWRASILASVIVASKVWDDFSMRNADFCTLFDTLTIERTNEMEVKLLSTLDYNVGVTVVEYTNWNCRLTDMAKKKKVRTFIELLSFKCDRLKIAPLDSAPSSPCKSKMDFLSPTKKKLVEGSQKSQNSLIMKIRKGLKKVFGNPSRLQPMDSSITEESAITVITTDTDLTRRSMDT